MANIGQGKDLLGEKFGLLTVINRLEDKKYPSGSIQRRWLCKCECGNTTVSTSAQLLSGGKMSCGCLIKTKAREKAQTNIYDLESKEYGIGYTNKGEEFYFDKEDYDLIKDYCWRIDPNYGYVITDARIGDDSPQKKIRLHRLVLNDWDYSHDIDHIHHNKFDNRKEFLRICDRSHNQMNKKKQSNNTTGVTGVYWDKPRQKWKAQIMVNQKTINIGRYDSMEEAIKARKAAEIKYFGEYRYQGDKCD